MNSIALEKTEIWIREKLRPMIHKGESFDVAKEMIGITLSAICETAFEYNMPEGEKKIFLLELNLAQKEFMYKSTMNPLRQWFGLFLPERRRAFAAGKKLNKIIMNVIDSYRKLEDPLKGTIIQQIMICDAYKNDTERTADLQLFLVAGYDTTSHSLAWILLELARNPAELRQLRESLSGMSAEEWSRSEVLKMAIKEGIRLHPVAAATSARVIGRDIITSTEKMLMPKGSTILVPPMLLLRNSDIYGDNADVFCPSRWENQTKEM
jgi:cytochrome P450